MKLVVCVVSGTLALAARPPRTAHLQGQGDHLWNSPLPPVLLRLLVKPLR